MATYNLSDVTSFTLNATAADINQGITIRHADQADNVVVILEHTGDSELPEVENTGSSLILRSSGSPGATRMSSGSFSSSTTFTNGNTTNNFFYGSSNGPRYDNADYMHWDFTGRNVPPGRTVINQGNIDINDDGVYINGVNVDDMDNNNGQTTANTLKVIVSIKSDVVLDALEVIAQDASIHSTDADWHVDRVHISTSNGGITGSFPLRHHLDVKTSNGPLKFSTLTQSLNAVDAHLDAHASNGPVDITMDCDRDILAQRRHSTNVGTSNGPLRGTYLYGCASDSFTTSNGNLDIVVVPSKGVTGGVRPRVSTSNGSKNCRVETWI